MWAIRGQNYLWLFMLAVNSLTPEAQVMAQRLEVAGPVVLPHNWAHTGSLPHHYAFLESISTSSSCPGPFLPSSPQV